MNEQVSLIILGAALAIAGGWISDEIRAWRERKRELKSIKIAIGDELGEIETTINNMHEVWTTAKVLSPSYISDLLANTTAFDNLRTRLFLIEDKVLRKKVVAFYKKRIDSAGADIHGFHQRRRSRDADIKHEEIRLGGAGGRPADISIISFD